MTTNHGFNTPQAGTTDWHIPLNENFKKIEVDAELRDVEANLGDYAPHDGAKFFASDTGAIFVGDGSNWQRRGNVARLGSDVYVQSSAPENPSKADVWIDTSGL